MKNHSFLIKKTNPHNRIHIMNPVIPMIIIMILMKKCKINEKEHNNNKMNR